MGVLGILTCEILELEFAYLLATDSDVARVTVIEDAKAARFIESLEARGFSNLQRIPHLNSFHPEPSEQLEIVIRVFELALHRNKKVLQHSLISAARELGLHVDAMLLGYGLCGSALSNASELLNLRVPVFVPMDENHPVDDCVGMFIGGRERYLAEQHKVPGTFFMTPGWACHWQNVLDGALPGAADNTLKRLFTRYERALLILTPIMSASEMVRQVEQFHKTLNLRVETCPGTWVILSAAWNSAKAYLKLNSISNRSPDEG